MPPRDPERRVLRVVTFNLWSGQKRDAARANLIRLAKDTDRPHVIALQEAKNYTGTIPGYQRIAPEATSTNREADNCVLLVRNDVDVQPTRHLWVKGPWWSWKKPHPPRVFAGATVWVEDGIRWDVLNAHRTPGGPTPGIKSNAASWAAEDAALEKWVWRRKKRRPGRGIVIVADWNDRANTEHPLSVSSLAHRVGGSLRLKGIDGAIAVNCVPRASELDEKYGSDGHHPVLVEATLKETA